MSDRPEPIVAQPSQVRKGRPLCVCAYGHAVPLPL